VHLPVRHAVCARCILPGDRLHAAQVSIDESRQVSVGAVVGAHNGVSVHSCGYTFLPVIGMLVWSGFQSKTEEGHYCGLKWQARSLLGVPLRP
jgi:hypothetical protein